MMRRSGLVALIMLVSAVARGAETAKDHPLLPLVKYASERYRNIQEQVKDYTCTLVKREQVDGQLSDTQFLFLKLRHARSPQGQAPVPFSVYLRFLTPAQLEGREVIYVDGRYNGKIIARRGGLRMAYMTFGLDPKGELAMQDNRYPITEIGFKNLIKRLVEVANEDMQYGECEVKYYPGAKINGRVCTMAQVTHPVRRPYFRYHLARLFIDDELQLPVRYAAYDWPETPGGPPRLMEEYTYLDIKLNVGLTDRDFDYHNESYNFRKDFEP